MKLKEKRASFLTFLLLLGLFAASFPITSISTNSTLRVNCVAFDDGPGTLSVQYIASDPGQGPLSSQYYAFDTGPGPLSSSTIIG